MKKIIFALLFLPLSTFSFGQLFVNEVDSDTPGTDIKEFVEIKSTTPNFSLTGYVLVFFNGGDNKSYLRYDLDGLTTNINGIFTVGNSAVSPAPNLLMNNNSIQNGPDAVAIYLGNAASFPSGTTATSTNLIHAMAYGNNDPNATALMNLLGLTVQQNEGLNGIPATDSVQRKNDGTYEIKPPTPGVNNDGTGTIQNGITISVTPTGNLLEGTTFNIIFTTQTAVTSNLNFSYTLNNGNFTTSDFSGNLTVTIPTGTSTISRSILLVDDTLNEGDEVMKITIGSIPSTFFNINNNVEIRINDNDNLVQAWGSPKLPTYGLTQSTAPAGYYASLEGKSGLVLKQAIQNIIANPLVVRKYTYGDVYDILRECDQNPNNSSQVWLMYVEQPRSKLDFQTGSSGALGFWNREHIYAQSRGGFSDATSSTPGGINNWLPTSASDISAGHSDAHHIRAEDSPENSIRSNRNYGIDYNGPTGNVGSWKGDVARSLFYMAVRYNGLNVVNGNPPETPDGFIGDLAFLLQWNTLDPSDDFEMNRNNKIYVWQQNRNPFIDFPNLANYIWGANAGQTWFSTLSNSNNSELKFGLYPNPAKNNITVSGLINSSSVEICSLSGQVLLQKEFNGETTFYFNLPTGIYILKIISDSKIAVKKLIVS